MIKDSSCQGLSLRPKHKIYAWRYVKKAIDTMPMAF